MSVEAVVTRLIKGLAELKIKKGDRIFVHSSYKSFGLPKGTEPKVIVEALKQYISQAGTIGMPVFTYSFQPENAFDSARSASCVGVVTEAFRNSSEVFRSSSPSHSVAFWGTDAGYCAEAPFGITPFSMAGPFGKLYQLNFKILMLGCGLASNSTLHAIEDWAGLPYCRKSIVQCYSCPAGNNVGGVAYSGVPKMHRDFYRTSDDSLNAKYVTLLQKHNAMLSACVGNTQIYAMNARTLVDICMNELTFQPDLFLCDDPACRECVTHKHELYPEMVKCCREQACSQRY